MKNSIRSLVAVLSVISLGSVTQSGAEEHDHDHDHAKETPKKAAAKPEKSKSVETQKKKSPPKEEHDDHDDHAEHGEKSEAGHAHKDEKKHGDEKHDEHGKEKHDDHGTEKHEEHGDEHAEEGASASVGPTKGILSASDEKGFQLSPEALKSFEIRSEKILSGTLSLAKNSIVHSGESVALFRLREGFFKKVPVKVLKRTDDKIQVQITDFRAGDEVVTRGAAFLRIAELDAAGGIGHGHSH